MRPASWSGWCFPGCRHIRAHHVVYFHCVQLVLCHTSQSCFHRAVHVPASRDLGFDDRRYSGILFPKAWAGPSCLPSGPQQVWARARGLSVVSVRLWGGAVSLEAASGGRRLGTHCWSCLRWGQCDDNAAGSELSQDAPSPWWFCGVK